MRLHIRFSFPENRQRLSVDENEKRLPQVSEKYLLLIHKKTQIMKSQFVFYSIAKDVKELGFDEPCLAIYRTDFPKGVDNFQFVGSHLIHVTINSNKIMAKTSIAAPLWQQVIDWLREEHGIWIEINMNYYDGDVNYTTNVVGEFPVVECFSGDKNPSIYPLAREIAILQAIEIIKKRKYDTKHRNKKR